jgi:hypothetical protein
MQGIKSTRGIGNTLGVMNSKFPNTTVMSGFRISANITRGSTVVLQINAFKYDTHGIINTRGSCVRHAVNSIFPNTTVMNSQFPNTTVMSGCRISANITRGSAVILHTGAFWYDTQGIVNTRGNCVRHAISSKFPPTTVMNNQFPNTTVMTCFRINAIWYDTQGIISTRGNCVRHAISSKFPNTTVMDSKFPNTTVMSCCRVSANITRRSAVVHASHQKRNSMNRSPGDGCPRYCPVQAQHDRFIAYLEWSHVFGQDRNVFERDAPKTTEFLKTVRSSS